MKQQPGGFDGRPRKRDREREIESARADNLTLSFACFSFCWGGWREQHPFVMDEIRRIQTTHRGSSRIIRLLEDNWEAIQKFRVGEPAQGSSEGEEDTDATLRRGKQGTMDGTLRPGERNAPPSPDAPKQRRPPPPPADDEEDQPRGPDTLVRAVRNSSPLLHLCSAERADRCSVFVCRRSATNPAP